MRQNEAIAIRIKRWSWLIAGTLSLVVLGLFLSLPALRLLGFSASVVTTGSMTPALPIDALVVTRPVDPQSIEVGDVIAFASRENRTVLHRVIEVIEQGEVVRFRTKGDANRTADSQLVHQKHVHGRMELAVEHLGALARLSKSPTGMLVLLPLQTPLLAWAWRGQPTPGPPPRRRRTAPPVGPTDTPEPAVHELCSSCVEALAARDPLRNVCPSWLLS